MPSVVHAPRKVPVALHERVKKQLKRMENDSVIKKQEEPLSSLIYILTARVFGAPQMISQPVSSIFRFSSPPSGTWRTPGLSIPLCCLPTSFSISLVFFPLSLCLARWFWPDLTNGRHVHTTAVCVSLRSSLYEMRSILW